MAIKFETNIPVKLVFPWGDFREVSSHYGQQYAYTVEQAGQRDKLFATAGLHHKLQEAGVRAGSEFTITKIEIEGNRKDWRIEGEEAPAPVAVVQQHGAQPNSKPATNGNGTTPKNGHAESPGFQDLKQAMQHCLNAAYGVGCVKGWRWTCPSPPRTCAPWASPSFWSAAERASCPRKPLRACRSDHVGRQGRPDGALSLAGKGAGPPRGWPAPSGPE